MLVKKILTGKERENPSHTSTNFKNICIAIFVCCQLQNISDTLSQNWIGVAKSIRVINDIILEQQFKWVSLAN
jgi:hypothetical protein